jgi:hypothetical protein
MWRSALRALGVLCFARPQLRAARTRFGLTGLAQVHHVVPRCCARHPTLARLAYDVEGDANFVLMPTREGVRRLGLRPNRLVHDGGHGRYCAYVWDALDAIETDAHLVALLARLHRGMRHDDGTIPWR